MSAVEAQAGGAMLPPALDAPFTMEQARVKAAEQLRWIVQTGVDAVLVTCTAYAALLADEQARCPVPVVLLDELLFNSLVRISGPQLLLFTNPGTVEGTLRRLRDYAAARHVSLDQLEVRVIDGVFELILQGRKAQYVAEVAAAVRRLLEAEPGKAVSVAQLSMVDSARLVEDELGVRIGGPLAGLREWLEEFVGEDVHDGERIAEWKG
ncbi:aspartate/glutamate racemase family protein [Paenibacillus sp. YYML68]|uniref:aspartate/glutamate racemase family protein n=1 Tax=Paenibacillus sp. YYML68 TaxID=2909250 RepID=UPI0037C86AC4